jgi:citrate lyase subunit alpha/citrate CoA-transferase
MLNAIGRELPEHVDGYGRVIPFAGAFAARPTTRRHAPPVKTVRPKGVRDRTFALHHRRATVG